MNRPEGPKGPRILPSILLRSDECPKKEPTRILLPKTFNDLKEKATKIFKLQNPIIAIYERNEHGVMIEDIYEVKPGRTYLISSINSKQTEKKVEKKISNTYRTKNQLNTNLNNLDNSYSYSDDDVLSFPQSNNNSIDSPKKDQGGSTKKIFKRKKSNLPIFHTIKHINQDADENEYNEEPEKKEQKYYFNSSSEVNFNDENKKVDNKGGGENYYDVDSKDDTVDENDDARRVIQIFDEAFPNHGFSDDVKNILELLPSQYLNFAKTALELENQQKNRWLSSLSAIANECGLSFQEEKVNYYQDIKNKCINIIKDHFFASQCGISTSIKKVIDGPSHSGKTTFLSILLNQYISTLASHNMWKNNFIIILNCEDFSFYAADLKILYFHFVKVTIEHLKAQVPESIPHSQMLQKYFETIVDENYLPVLPKKFSTSPSTMKLANAVKAVSTLLNQNWRALNGRESFCTLIFLMPVLIAKNLGYKDVTLFVDHFDLIHLEIDEMDHFPESLGELFLIEYFKNVLIQTNFVISSKDSNELWQCFQPFEESDIDLTNIVSFESTMDTNSEAKYGNKEFTFSIQNINCKINAQHFGGIPAYITKWIELNELMDLRDDPSNDSDDFEEKNMDVENHLQSILPLIFTDVNPNARVESVRRREIKEK